MSTTNGKLEQLYAHADMAEALEHAAAGRASKGLRDQLQVISRWFAASWVMQFGSLEAQADPAGLSAIMAELRDRLALIDFDPSAVLTYWAGVALNLGVEQALREMDLHISPIKEIPTIGKDSEAAIVRAAKAVNERIAKAQRLSGLIRGGNHSDAMVPLAVVHRAVSDVEMASRWVTNREVNRGSYQVAAALDGGVMWVAERNACLNCIAYSGVVADNGNSFPPDLTFGAKPVTPWPDGVLTMPPLHPHCRCRITVWLGSDSDYSLSDALKHEARRSVLKGWSLPSESENARLRAADRLLRRGAGLPKSVEQQARRAVRRGHFVSRTVPKP